MTRKFGIEIEAYGVSMEEVARALTAAGVNTLVEGYNHHTRGHWKVVSDASLRGLTDSFELVSPVLEGEDGLKQLKIVGETLTRLNAKVHMQCGLHVHVDARDLQLKQVSNVCKMFAKYETCFDSVMPMSRRNNRFCASVMDGRTLEQVFEACDKAKNITELRGTFNHWNRYKKLNLESLDRHGTVEFRQHSGTVDATKMIEWVKLVTGFVVEAANAKTIRTVGAGKFENLLTMTDRSGKKFYRERAVKFAA